MCVELVVDAGGVRTAMLKFTRPLVSGHLYAEYGMEASILSKPIEFEGDIIWAVGSDTVYDENTAVVIAANTTAAKIPSSSSSECAYHSNRRGLRVIDWVNPEYSLMEEWKCV